MNDGSTHKVTNGKDGQNGAQGEPGVAGDKVVIDKTTGAITINDEPTGFYAAKNAETGKFAVPEIGEDGFWYVVNKEGKMCIRDSHESGRSHAHLRSALS